MSGIAGIFRPAGEQVAEGELQPMLNRILYRGPDGSGLYVSEEIGIAHARLSTQDVSAPAVQPIFSRNKRYVLAYDGEIYRVRELRDELKREGVGLELVSDAEALLEYLATFDVEKALPKVEGMFALALWDQQERTLTLARDRYGMKPLFYAIGPKGEVRFASEMKALISSSPEPDLCTLNATLLGLGATWGEPTVFQDVRHVCAGECLVFSKNIAVQRSVFFHINDFVNHGLYDKLKSLSMKEVIDKVADTLQESIEVRLIANTAIGAVVSGGVDSGLAAAIACRQYSDLRLYHANVISNSEISAAQHTAQTLGLKLRSVNVSDEDVLDNTPIVTYHYEIPIIYASASVPSYMVSKLAAKDGTRVVLTGEGCDECFMGYPAYAIEPYLRLYRRVLGSFQNLLHCSPAIGNLLWPKMDVDPSRQLRQLMFRYELEERRGEAAKVFDFVRNRQELSWHVRCIDNIIGNFRTSATAFDRLSVAAWGVETRFPFLDHRLVEIAVNLHSRYKYHKTLRFSDRRHPFISDKWIARKIAERYLPRDIAHRSKRGFQASVFQRLNIDKRYFHTGFVAEYYKLNNRAIDYLFDTATALWLSRMMLLEVWGQIFVRGNTIDMTRENLRRHVTIK